MRELARLSGDHGVADSCVLHVSSGHAYNDNDHDNDVFNTSIHL